MNLNQVVQYNNTVLYCTEYIQYCTVPPVAVYGRFWKNHFQIQSNGQAPRHWRAHGGRARARGAAAAHSSMRGGAADTAQLARGQGVCVGGGEAWSKGRRGPR